MSRPGVRPASLLAAAIVAVLVLPLSSATAVPSTTVTRGVMSPVSEAQDASSSAKGLRRDVAIMLQKYIDEYRTRFSAEEIAQLQGYRANADRQLANVVLATNRIAYLTAHGATSAHVREAVVRATATWSRAKRTAETSWEDARRIMEPKLSLFEKIGAANDYDTMMNRFDTLGTQIKAVAKAGTR